MIDLSKLVVGKQLGGGGQGRVFFASEPGGKRLCIKIVEGKPGLDPSQRLAALRADDLVGPIVPVMAQARLTELPAELRSQLKGMPRDGLFMVMPFVPGASLARIRAAGPFTPLETAATLAAIAAKLTRLPRGVAHGDLRAPNVLVQPDGELSLIDPDLFREPGAAEDVAALGALGRELLDGVPTGSFASLLDELENRSRPPKVPEAAALLGSAAQSLGASPGNLGSVLVPRVAPVAKEIDAPVVAAAPLKRKRWRPARWMAGLSRPSW